MIKKCANPNCNKYFKTTGKNQKYCCTKCRKQVARKTEIPHIYIEDGIPIREFNCRECGGRVVIKSPKDRRTVFCCVAHERRYWKHPERYTHRLTANLGMSGGMTLGNLIRREKMDLL